MKNTIHILVGLPGSGKTYYAKKMIKEHPEMLLISEDEIIKNYGNCYNINYEINLELIRKVKNKKDIIVDSLFLTNKSIYDLLVKVNKEAKNYKVVLHVWNEDRETCVKNDTGRRLLNSKQTILTVPYESIDLNYLSNSLNFNFSIENHMVVLKEDWKLFLDEKKRFHIKNGNLISSEWCLGGVTGNYMGETYPAESEPQPDFDELDELLELVCPNITYLQYKKLKRQCVKIVEEERYEYYGSHYTYAHYECDLDIFAEILENLNITNNLNSLK